MIKINSPSRVFLSGPLTMFADKKTGMIDPTVVRTLKLMLKHLRQNGHQVFCAHELEQWGAATKELTIPQIMKRDLSAIQAADYVFIMPNFGGKYSEGTIVLEMAPITMRLSALKDINGKSELMTRDGKKIKPPKGIIYLHHKGSEIDPHFDSYMQMFRKLYPNHFEYLEFEKPSDLVKIVKSHAPKISQAKKVLGRARLNAARLVLGRAKLKHYVGATYFTSKPRKRPL
jgi:hypothetical protein